METRLLPAFVLMGAVLFTTPYFSRPPRRRPLEDPPFLDRSAPVVGPGCHAYQDGRVPIRLLGACADRSRLNRGDCPSRHRALFRRRTAAGDPKLDSKKYDSNQKPLEVINPKAAVALGTRSHSPSSVNRAALAVDLNTAPSTPSRLSDDGLEIDFEFSDGKYSAQIVSLHEQQRHLAQVSSEVTDGAAPVPHLLDWRGGFGDMTVPSPAAAQHSIH